VNLSTVLSKVKKRPTRKRCGRGPGSGLGKTSGRGHKGAASRSGWKRRYGYDGGQTSLVRRLPKRGFSNHRFRNRYDVVNLLELEAHFANGEEVTLSSLEEKGILHPVHGRLKVLGLGDLKKNLKIVAHTASAAALSKITASGSKFQALEPPKKKKSAPKPAPKPAGANSPVAKKPKKQDAQKEPAEGAAE
jgi:large subunit ribosomal protein L15